MHTRPHPASPLQNAERLDSEIVYDRDFDYDYFGFKVGGVGGCSALNRMARCSVLFCCAGKRAQRTRMAGQHLNGCTAGILLPHNFVTACTCDHSTRAQPTHPPPPSSLPARQTLERSYLLRINGRVVERPQHMLMRVSVGIHKEDIESAVETYHLLSQRWFTHASPTLFNAGTPRPQLSSCFLVCMKNDSIEGARRAAERSIVWHAWGTGACFRAAGTAGSAEHVSLLLPVIVLHPPTCAFCFPNHPHPPSCRHLRHAQGVRLHLQVGGRHRAQHAQHPLHRVLHPGHQRHLQRHHPHAARLQRHG